MFRAEPGKGSRYPELMWNIVRVEYYQPGNRTFLVAIVFLLRLHHVLPAKLTFSFQLFPKDGLIPFSV